ncbi:tRNA(His) guanylyltransferase Thg1 family protein [Actinoplanes awajinensis]|uniref:tRNA(His) guanylyltransferase n=1 Tax=Actinoplanes awajinensis subsp. mycoplanecinus TaxID=135947 RepID=A0A101JJP2_9ACTN|nr:tRNA(His) guanylyltransferase Thg1 family protein [Actinoplanes awajinensis]KUL27666.1 tRNA 5'-guanylyltransferase [Actinoplanes awajinensis subsp. mycoplanecinus]
MDADAFEAGQRAREYFHSLTVLPGAWTVLRLDGRGFSRLTEQHFTKPFDERFAGHMTVTAQTLLTELGARYAYTASDEISLLFDPRFDLFGRGVEKLVSISAGIASATFTQAAGVAGHFDSRVWLGTAAGDVADYFSWRQGDVARSALNGWCYWTLRNGGASRSEASRAIDGASTAEKNELLFRHGINFNEVPAWQRRGVGLWWIDALTKRRRICVERELPMKNAYRELVFQLIG